MMRRLQKMCTVFLLIALSIVAKAQNTLIHYWHFNNVASGTAPGLSTPVDADYSILDTSKARIYYRPFTVSGTYASSFDFTTPGDLINVRQGQTAGNYLRLKNPSDSMEARFYMPTTGYKNIKFSFEVEASSSSNGAKTQYFDYSIDSGATWRTGGMTVQSVAPNKVYPAQDSVTAAWGQINVTFDTTVNNTNKFVVRMKFGTPNTGTSGNDRFDNVTLDGDSIINVVPPPPPAPDTFVLIHYWHFNSSSNTGRVVTLPSLTPTNADYSALDTSKARFYYMPISGTSALYTTSYDFQTPGDTLNAKLGHATDVLNNYLRLKNPSDSMEARFYMPTTGFKHITFSFDAEASSTGNGAKTQYFDYSIDSGATWRTTGMSVYTTATNTTRPAQDSVTAAWGKIAVTFDSSVNNNSRFVVRVKFGTPNTGTSGNDRLDNVTLEGDTLIVVTPPPPAPDTFVLIHYWHFNSSSNTGRVVTLPSLAPTDADYSILDTSKARIYYMPMSGVSSAYATSYDFSTPGDTLNAKLGHATDVLNNYIRFRNPSDSMEARFYMPTTGFKHITFSYDVQASSATNGAKTQYFDYSIDSGATWRTTGMSVYTTATNTTRSAQDSVTAAWGKIAVTFDSSVNNNNKFVVRVKFGTPNTGTSGNDRIDNVTLEGDTMYIVTPPPPPPVDTFVLIHYWHFNSASNTGRVVALPSLAPTDADYSVLDTSKARIYYMPMSGVSSAYTTSYDFSTPGDTLNAKLGHAADALNNYMRFRNPSDSMEARFYMPTTGFKHITFSYDVQASGTTNGAKTQYFDYSVDSGATWRTTGMSVYTTATNTTLPSQDSVTAAWGKIIVKFDSSVNNNNKFVVRVKFGPANTGTSGNDRLDNVTLEGDTMIVVTPPPPPPVDTFVLIHYWHFNSSSNTGRVVALPSLAPTDADYSVLDTSKARIYYMPMPGVSSAYATSYDFSTPGDTLNAKLGHAADVLNNYIRFRNPSDSMEARFYMPTTGFKHITFSYDVEASSAGNGAKTQYFDYSVDSGATWRTTGMSVYTMATNTTRPAQDSVTAAWGKIAVSFDSSVNNTDKFVVRVKFGTPNTGTSGNDRLDNVTLEGDTIGSVVIPPPPPPVDTFKLVHYWHFNNFNTAYHNPGIPAIDADYSSLDTAKARIMYTIDPGTSSNYSGYIDPVTGDTLNAKMNQPAGNGLRVRNPSDSMSLVCYIPTTHYKDIHVRYEVASSSFTSGQLQQQFAYSVDSGTTWTTAGLNMSSDSVGLNWSVIGLDFGNDTTVNNNPRLALRIRFAGNTTGTSGNNRFDNFTVEGDTMVIVTPPPPPPADTFALIHYWNFNNITIGYHNPGIPSLHADYSILDTSKARLAYVLDSGTSASYAGYIDNVTGDTLNAKMNAPAGNGLRVRNPSDSMSIVTYMPTTHFKDIHVRYEVSSSSLTSGQRQELFAYSVDSGATWTTAGLNMTSDSIGINWSLVNLDFGSDTMVNNNARLAFRIRFAGNTTGTSGNNRFDNLTVEGNPLPNDTIPPPPPPVDTFKLVHYWHFNNFNTTYTNPNIPAIDADYSTLDTAKARMVYTLDPGTSGTYAGYIDPVTGDTLNAKMNQPAGNALRVRNPSDSMSLVCYIPTTHYKDIHVRYEVSSSSLTSGQLQQQFAYSTDSGATWTTTGLNMTADSIGVNWSVVALDFGNDQTVNNNPRLAFRIRFAGNTTGSSGNNRFDNFTVEGDTMIVTPPPPPDTTKLIHYWHFNTFSGTYTNPNIPHIDADYSILDTSKAQVVYQLDPGTSAAYAGHIDEVTGDTLNARMGQGAGNGLRVRNPSDSMSLLLYIPTTHYKNIKLKYEVQASSLTSGQLQENFDYSVDSGMTWKTAGLNKTSDSMSVNWKLESLSFGSDTTVNNNAGLVFRIRFAGNTTGTSGNNRFDNITVEGDTLTAATDTGNYVNNINTVHSTCTVYPNPAADQIFISTPADNSKTISIYNVTGQKVYAAYRSEQLVTIQVAGLRAGMYYITVHDNKTAEDYILRFIKQ